jgi:hypothetical protein
VSYFECRAVEPVNDCRDGNGILPWHPRAFQTGSGGKFFTRNDRRILHRAVSHVHCNFAYTRVFAWNTQIDGSVFPRQFSILTLPSDLSP